MGHARAYQTATLLADGRVLIAGGDGDPEALASAELYDPATGTFSPTGRMLHARESHTATLLPDGRVLVAGGIGAGGYPSGVLSSAELYDPATGTFSATGSMAHVRFVFTATLLLDGRVLIAGGYGSTAEVYDPAHGTFSPTGSMTIDRVNAAAARLPDGRVLIAGGEGACLGCTQFLATAELYDPARGTFSPTGSMGHARVAATATRLSTGRVLVAGGQASTRVINASAELYDPASGRFSATGSMAAGSYSQWATLLSDARVLVTGGLDASAQGLARSETDDPVSGRFSRAGLMAVGRSSHTATLLPDGRVLVTGGVNDTGVLASAEVWQP
jgi:hypothetical protein